MNTNFEVINSFEHTNIITNIVVNKSRLIFSAENELFILNTNKIAEGFPIKSDGYFNIADIDNNGKINLINTKNGFIYNYELAD